MNRHEDTYPGVHLTMAEHMSLVSLLEYSMTACTADMDRFILLVKPTASSLLIPMVSTATSAYRLVGACSMASNCGVCIGVSVFTIGKETTCWQENMTSHGGEASYT
jgi:hypothetical protein